MLTTDQIAQYHDHGYVVPDFQMPPDLLEAIKARHAKLLDGHPEFRDYCPALFDYDLGFLDYASNREILDMVEQLIGGDIALWLGTTRPSEAFLARAAFHRLEPLGVIVGARGVYVG